MYKHLFRTALGLIGMMGTLAIGVVSATNGITTNADGSKTVVRNNINLTIASGNLDGFYGRGNNIAGDSTIYRGAQNNNRWGGSGDAAINGYSPNPTNFDERRGPCPIGRHVPSRGERNALVIAWCNLDNNCNTSDLRHAGDWTADNNLIYIEKSGLGAKFLLAFNIESDNFWSSSHYPKNTSAAYSLYVYDDGIQPYTLGRHTPLHVRCFQNPQPIKITYDPNGGSFSGKAVNETTVVTYTPGETYTPDINIQFPNKESDNMSAQSGWMFDGWYTTGVLEYQTSATEWTGFVDENTESQTVYAKWLPFNDLPAITGNDGTEYILMDRNLGATDVWNYGDAQNTAAKNGKYYQWGNNYGFSSDSSISPWPYTDTNMVVNTTGTPWGPGNYYSSATFITRSDSPYRWDDADNANLWGGNGDTTTADGDGTTEEGRQGPCPSGYHVPSTREWQAIYDALGLSGNATSVEKLQTTLHLPMAGNRNRANSNVLNQGSYGFYWSSSRYNASTAYNLYFNSSAIIPQYNISYRSSGFSVRCLKDSPTHTLTFNATENGASTTSQTSVEAITGSSVTLPSCNETKTGFTCIGWNTDATAHEGLASITLNEDKTVYAIFKKDITATYTATNASISGNQTSGSCTLWNKDTSCSITLPSITCNTGYHTPAWTPENLDNITADSSAIASCTANTYTVHFVAGEGTGSMNNQDFTYGVAQNLTANTFTKTGHIFSGWTDGTTGYTDGQEVSNLTTTNGDTVTLTAQWRANEHKLSFIVDGNVVQSGNVAYGTDISAPANPTKDCNSFAGWTSSVEGVTTTGTMPDSDVTFTATWNYTCSRSSGGGGSRKSGTSTQDSSTSSQNDTKTSDSGEQAKQGNVNTQNSSSESQNDGNTQQKTYSEEFQKAYGFAHESGITTMDTIEKAEMDQPLTRIAMAKMLSQYAINVLGKKPANITVPKFKDVSEKLDTEYDNGVTLAYQLGIMGINMKNNEFRPFDYVTRAEFATALSRLLFDTPDGKDVYYSTHLRQLMEKKIITNDDPRLQELRGYVMIMLMRSAED